MLRWTLGCMYIFELQFLCFPQIYPEVGLLDYIVTLFILRNLHIFSIVVVTIYISINCLGGLLFSTSSPAFIIFRLFDEGHSHQCKVPQKQIVVLICIPLIRISNVEHLFMSLLAMCMSSLEKHLLSGNLKFLTIYWLVSLIEWNKEINRWFPPKLTPAHVFTFIHFKHLKASSWLCFALEIFLLIHSQHFM